MQELTINILDNKKMTYPSNIVLVEGENLTTRVTVSAPVWDGLSIGCLITTPAGVKVDEFSADAPFKLTNTMLDRRGYIRLEFVGYKITEDSKEEVSRTCHAVELPVRPARSRLGEISPEPLPDLITEVTQAKNTALTAAQQADAARDSAIKVANMTVVAETLAAGTPATATLTDGEEAKLLTFGIPQGAKGDKGDKGDTGNTGATGATGAQGIQGVPGEVTTAQLNAALADVARELNIHRGSVFLRQDVVAASKTTAYNNFQNGVLNAYVNIKKPIICDYIMVKTFRGLNTGNFTLILSYVSGTVQIDFSSITCSGGTIESSKLARISFTSADIDGWLLMDWTIFLSFYSGANWYVENQMVGTIYKINPNIVRYNSAELPTPFYDGMYSKLAVFAPHFYAKDKDVTIVIEGDSISITNTYTTELLNPAERPPLLNRNNFASRLWDKIKWDGQIYRRFDYTGAFSETGAWTTKETTTYNGDLEIEWDENGTTQGVRPTINRYTDTAGATVAFQVPATYRRSGFIYRSEANGSSCTIEVTEGNGYLEAWNGSAWVEANGYAFTTIETVTTPNQSISVYQKRLKFRCVEAHVSVAKNVTITKGAGTRLAYWGVEHSLDDHVFYLIVAARGSHNHAALWAHVENEVYGFDPDLIIHQIPIANDLSPAYQETHALTDGTDILYTHCLDATNEMSYISRSSNFTRFDVIFYMPFFANAGAAVDTAGEWRYWSSGGVAMSVRDYFNAYIKYLCDRQTLNFVNTFDRMVAECKLRGTLYSMTQPSSANGQTVTIDGTHPNDLGNGIIAKYILPCFDF